MRTRIRVRFKRWRMITSRRLLRLPHSGSEDAPLELPKNLQGWYDGHTRTTIMLRSGWQYRSPAFTLFDLQPGRIPRASAGIRQRRRAEAVRQRHLSVRSPLSMSAAIGTHYTYKFMQRPLKILALLLAAVTALPLWSGLAVLFPPQLPKVDFTRDIQPIFQARCAKCHGGEKQMAQLNLLDQQSVARVVIAGNSKDSRLVRRISGLNNEARMPKDDETLKAEQIELIKRWIDEGADYPAAASFETGVKKHWAFVAPVRPPAPEVKNKAWIRNPIDAFILARLEKENLTPSPEADKITLLRRLSLDLIGLPPTPEEVDAFLKDASPQAYEEQVERLLASPHY